MKISITKKHEYLTGWTSYDMVWKTDYAELGKKNITLLSVVVVSKDSFSVKILKKWATEKGYDLDPLFTKIDNNRNDCDKTNNLIKAFDEEYGKNLDALNNDNKCHIQYSASINKNYKPLVMAFDTILAYDVKVCIEYKSGVLEGVFLSQGRKKNDYCPMIMLSGKHMMETLYEEKEAIYKIESRLERYINDCDTDEKFNELPKILREIQDDLKRFK